MIRIKVTQGARVTMEHCIKITKAQTILNGGTPRPLLVDGRGMLEMPEECRNYLLSNGQAKLNRACALVVSENSNGLGLALINSFNALKEQFFISTPHRIFKALPRAEHWIYDYQDINQLDETERRVLRGAIYKTRNLEIARECSISEKQIYRVRERIYKKLGTDDPFQITRMIEHSRHRVFFAQFVR